MRYGGPDGLASYSTCSDSAVYYADRSQHLHSLCIDNCPAHECISMRPCVRGARFQKFKFGNLPSTFPTAVLILRRLVIPVNFNRHLHQSRPTSSNLDQPRPTSPKSQISSTNFSDFGLRSRTPPPPAPSQVAFRQHHLDNLVLI